MWGGKIWKWVRHFNYRGNEVELRNDFDEINEIAYIFLSLLIFRSDFFHISCLEHCLYSMKVYVCNKSRIDSVFQKEETVQNYKRKENHFEN